MCHLYIICYVSTTSALPEKVTFSLQWASQSEGKSGLRPRSPKNVAKVGQRAPKWRRRGGHGGPRVAQGLQNGSPNRPSVSKTSHFLFHLFGLWATCFQDPFRSVPGLHFGQFGWFLTDFGPNFKDLFPDCFGNVPGHPFG